GGPHGRRQPREDEDGVMPANRAPASPYGVFLSSLRPPKAKGALLNDANMGEPVLVFTGTKPRAPGAVQAGWGEPAKPKGKRTAKTSAKDKEATAKDGAKGKEASGDDA